MKNIFALKKPFIGFITACDGGLDYSLECALQMIEGGVDILELGFPFSDPVADGAEIQASSQRALEQGVKGERILELARRLRQRTDVPLILFSYFNNLLQQGESYLKSAAQAGFLSVLIVDLPPFDYQLRAEPFFASVKQAGLSSIYIASPSTDDPRLAEIARASDPFVYYACRKGTTGQQAQLPIDLRSQLTRIRRNTTQPVVVGFGIANRDNARLALESADGFVVGSAFVELMRKKASPADLKRLAKDLDPREAARSS